MTRWVESNLDYLSGLADPIGNGLITSVSMESDPNPKPLRRRAHRVMIRGKLFRSYKRAAEAFGISHTTVRRAALSGTADCLMPRHWWEIEGIEFNTIKEAAEFFQISTKTARACAKKLYLEDPLKTP